MPRTRLRLLLLVLGLPAALPGLLVLLYILSGERREAANGEISSRAQIGRAAAGRIASTFVGADRLLGTLAAVPEFRGTDRKACTEILSAVLRTHPGYSNLMVGNLDGSLFCSGRPVDRAKFGSSAGPSWFAQVQQTRAMMIGQPQISSTSGKAIVIVAGPILDKSGAVTRVIGAGLEAGQLSEDLSDSQLGPGTSFTLINDRGVIVAHYPVRSGLVGHSFADEAKSIATDSGSAPRATFHFAPLPTDAGFGAGYRVAMEVDPNDQLSAGGRVERYFLLLMLAAAILGAGATLIVAEWWVVRPAETLRRQATRLAAGDFTARARIRGGLFGLNALGDTFDAMAAAIEARQQERDEAIGDLLASQARNKSLFERTEFALEAARVGVWEANLMTDVTHWSPVCESLYGMAPNTFGGTSEAFMAAIHPDDRGLVQAGLQHGLESRTDFAFEFRPLLSDGTVRKLKSVGRFFYDGDGKPIRGAGIVQDVTERRSLEEQLLQAQKMEAIGQLAGGVAHDFNNLLTVIGGNTDFAIAEIPADNPAVADLEQVRLAVDRASQMTRQLLAFGRQQVLKTDVVDLDVLVERLTPMLRRLIEEDITLTHLATTDHPTAVCDAAQFEQAVINLVVNARDAMPGGGSIRIVTGWRTLTAADILRERIDAAPGRYVTLAVADSGTGMSPEVLARAFEPFFTTKEVGKGTGLGLSSVYGTVKQSGGHIVAQSRVGSGTTFTILLPRVEAVEPDAVGEATEKSGREGAGITVLLVEDEASVRVLAERMLTGAGYRVLATDRADVALARARRFDGAIHLVLSDVVMPGPSIVEAIDTLRMERPSIATLLMSGYPDAEVGRRINARDVDYLSKPFTRDALLARVRTVLARRGERADRRQAVVS